MFRRNQVFWLPCAVLVVAASSAAAAPNPVDATPPRTPTSTTDAATPASTLKQAFDAAWQRQPEALSQQSRLDAAAAQQEAATRWTPEPVALELSTKTDRLNQNLGRDETAFGISIPLWLPGERTRTVAVADAQARATSSRVRAAQLRTAASVREAFWAWQRAGVDHVLAAELLGHAQQLAQDVAKRVRAGDMARADQHQADGAVAGARVALAEASSAMALATQRLRALTGVGPTTTAANAFDVASAAEATPTLTMDAAAYATTHPALLALQDSADMAQRTAELARVQTRANPELTLATSRDRGQLNEAYQSSITLGIRIPLGSDSRNRAKGASVEADAIEADALLWMEREHVQGEVEAARVGVESAQTQLQASQQRAVLARESRAFFQKSYRMGETDLPTRLRIEREAMDAERQAARAGVDLAAAQSNLRQSLGLLPQ